MELEVCWSGNSWRQYPQPEIAPPTYYGKLECDGTRVVRASQAGAAEARWTARELVYAVLSNGGWHSVKGVCHRTGLSDRRVRSVLMHGALDGKLERMDGQPARVGLRPIFLYRRRPTTEVAA